jgi:replicative DNA helicase
MTQEPEKSTFASKLGRWDMKQIISKAEARSLPGVPSGLTALDRATKGWKRSTLTVIAGPPSMGCSSLLLSFMQDAVVYFRKPTALFSLQLSREQILTKWLSAESEIPYERIETGDLKDHEWLDISRGVTTWQENEQELIRVMDDPNPTIDKVIADCRQLREEGIDLFLIDNINRITLTKEARLFCANREQEVSYIIRNLKTLARELDAPIVVVGHLNRVVKERAHSYRPQLGDLRDSGTIEYEADLIILLHRPEYYKQTEDEMGNPTRNVADLIIAKNAFGNTETVQVQFKSACGRFSDLELPDYSSVAVEPEYAPGTIRLGSRINSKMPFPRSVSNDDPPF